jgi:hypothetical protein
MKAAGRRDLVNRRLAGAALRGGRRMTQFEFDELSRALAKTTSRRGAVKLFGTAVVGGLVSLIGARGASARLCRDIGDNCRSNAECCSRFCATGPFKCACPTGTEVCAGECLPLCPGQTVRDPVSCQCVCPPATTPCGSGLCCPQGQICVQGQCRTACPQGTTPCGSTSCCNNQQVCQNGVCLSMCPGVGFCPAPLTCCHINPGFPGTCCAPGQTCTVDFFGQNRCI